MAVIQHVKFDHFFSISIVVSVVRVGHYISIISITVGGGRPPVVAVVVATHFIAVDVDTSCCSECSGRLINRASKRYHRVCRGVAIIVELSNQT